MADDISNTLAVTLEARTAAFAKALDRIERQTSSTFQKIPREAQRGLSQLEKAVADTDRRMSGLGRSLIPSLGAIGGALSIREVARYADAWTGAKNALAVAGVTGQQQVKLLDALYQSAQRTAAPFTALADLYGKAAQASDNLGASQGDLLKFSGGVATALRVAGTSATAASGALTQLGQLLGSARVQAEEFNSVNEGARPILLAVANGLDAAGGSVNRLKQLVNDGKVSGQQFFQAFLKGLPEIEKMAANATTTIDQGMTKVSNALTRYIGQTDSSLGASQRLVAGLSALADNFDETADIALKFAGIIAGALVGRSIASMLTSLGQGTAAVVSFGRAIAGVRTVGFAASVGGIGAALGPVGALIGTVVAGSLLLFSQRSDEATTAARTYAGALETVRAKADEASKAIDGTSSSIDAKTANALQGGIDEGTSKIEEARQAVLDLFRQIIDNAPKRLVSDEQLASLEDLRTRLETGKASAGDVEQSLFGLANSNPKFQTLADQLSPLLNGLKEAVAAVDLLKQQLGEAGNSGPSFRETESASMDAYRRMKSASDGYIADAQRRAALTRDQLALETEIANVRNDALKQGITLTEAQVEQIAKLDIDGDKSRSKTGHTTTRERANAYEELTQRVRESTDAQKAENAVLATQNPLIGDFGYAIQRARTEFELLHAAQEAGIPITAELSAEIGKISDGYARAGADAQKLQAAADDTAKQIEDGFQPVKELFEGLFDGSIQSLDDLADHAMKPLCRLSQAQIASAFSLALEA